MTNRCDFQFASPWATPLHIIVFCKYIYVNTRIIRIYNANDCLQYQEAAGILATKATVCSSLSNTESVQHRIVNNVCLSIMTRYSATDSINLINDKIDLCRQANAIFETVSYKFLHCYCYADGWVYAVVHSLVVFLFLLLLSTPPSKLNWYYEWFIYFIGISIL